MPNRLSSEKSPYLLQHAHNPVDWLPWGSEALETAQREDKPILVSIGYSACHWCHVMERESFEDDATARLMNEYFVNVKVDREERPDVDAIYMEAVQALTGQGGWPLNVFLTPDGRPFYGGTYFPPGPGRGLPAWTQVLEGVARAYREQREGILQNASTLTAYIQRAQDIAQSGDELTSDHLSMALRGAMAQSDWQDGGFGGAPKFPQPLALELLLRMSKRFGDEEPLRFVDLTLDHMAKGGIFDQIGGGFHRYTVDAHWVVPHFEKMLYDNALLARVYLQAYQITGNAAYRSVVECTLDYLLRDMRSPEGGFYSAEDADSEGVEGKYYVWTPEEVEAVLSPDQARAVRMRYGIEPGGNFEGRTILMVAMPLEEIARRLDLTVEQVARLMAEARAVLLEARSRRVPPGKDTKILVSWNALAIRALAEAGRVLKKPEYSRAAVQAADFVLESLRPEGRLVRSYKDGAGDVGAFLEDYALLIEALVALYQTEFDPCFLSTARRLASEMAARFKDAAGGPFFDSEPTDQLIVRPRSVFDNPIPSGNAAAASGLLRLAALTGDQRMSDFAIPAFRVPTELVERAPLGFTYLLSVLDFYLSAQTQIAIVGAPGQPDTEYMVDAVYDRYRPNVVVSAGREGDAPLLEGRSRLEGRPTAYVCQHFSCRTPTASVEGLIEQLENASA